MNCLKIPVPAMTEMFAIRKTTVHLALIFLVSIAFAQTTQERIAAIAAALRNQQFDQALQLLHPALQQSPGNAELWTMQGVAYAGPGQKKEAVLVVSPVRSKLSPRLYPRAAGSRPNRIRGRQSGRIPIMQHLLRLASEGRYDERNARGLGDIKKALQGRSPISAAGRVLFESKPRPARLRTAWRS